MRGGGDQSQFRETNKKGGRIDGERMCEAKLSKERKSRDGKGQRRVGGTELKIKQMNVEIGRGRFRYGGRRCNSLLNTHSLPCDCASYQRLSSSQSTTSPESERLWRRRRKIINWTSFWRLFSSSSPSSSNKQILKGRPPDVLPQNKKRSAWLPDPNRRWPIQGW